MGYEERAQECVRLANSTTDEMIRTELLKLRQSYLQIAERVGIKGASRTNRHTVQRAGEGIRASARVFPYYTNSIEYSPLDRAVYHDRGDCSDGRRIKPEHRTEGTAGRLRCKECAKLG